MKTILLKNHKVFIKKHLIRDEYEVVETDTLAPYLQCVIEECENFTFGDLWKFIEPHAELYDLVFMQAMGGHSIDAFHKDAHTPSEPKDDPITYVEVYRFGEVSKHDDEEPSLEIGAGFHGIGPGKFGGEFGPGDEQYSLSLSPISEYMSKPIRLNTKFHIDLCVVENQKHKFGSFEEVNMPLTVYDLLEAILNDITFYGEPADRAAKLADLDQKLSQFKATLPNEEKS